jgi:hypothetical protein
MNKKNQNGVTIIAAIFIIVVLGFMGVMFLTMINTGSFTAVNDIQSAQALYVAEGGAEYAQYALAQNRNWYRSVSDPMPAPASAILNLGVGSFFNVSTNLPATRLSLRLLPGIMTATVYLNLPGRFPSAGWLQIEDNIGIGGTAEFVQYTNLVAGNVFTLSNRNVTISGVTGTTLGNHPRGSVVYPVSTLSTALGTLGSPCAPTPAASFDIVANTKFLSGGTIDIQGEEIGYASSTTTAGVMTLNGVIRCLNQTSSAHAGGAGGSPVTPVLFHGDTADCQAEITSTGTMGAAVRTVKKTVQR